MLSAFNLVFAGGIYIPPEILGRRGAISAGDSRRQHRQTRRSQLPTSA